MKISQNDVPALLSSTTISDLFFSDYFNEATGDAIKVYLYLNFLSKYNKEIKLTDLSKTLNIKYPDIQGILAYWESKEIIRKNNNNTGYVLVNLQDLELHKLYTPKVSISANDLAKNVESQAKAKVIESINNQFFNGTMSPTWYSDIATLFEKYKFDDDVMLALFADCHSKSALHRNYINVVAQAWADKNIHTYNELEMYYQKQDTLNTLYKNISKKLRLSRQLTNFETEYIDKWNIDFGFSQDVIEMAFKKGTGKSLNFNYYDTILTDWHEHNLKTANEVTKYITEDSEKNKNIAKLSKQSSMQNFDGRDYSDINNFNSLYANSISIDDLK